MTPVLHQTETAQGDTLHKQLKMRTMVEPCTNDTVRQGSAMLRMCEERAHRPAKKDPADYFDLPDPERYVLPVALVDFLELETVVGIAEAGEILIDLRRPRCRGYHDG